MSKIKFFMAIPTVGTVCDAQAYSLRKWQENFGDKAEFIYPKDCVRRIFHDFARNEMVDEFLASNCDVLCFLDSDIAPSGDMLDLYLKYYEEWDCAGAAYPVFMTQPGSDVQQVVFTVYKGTEGLGLAPCDIPMSGTDYVDGIATGCLFLKRHVIEQLSKPYFEFKYDPTTRKMLQGEDIGFCQKIRQLGYKFFIDYSKTCKHYKTVCLLEVNQYAAEYARKSVNTYAESIKKQVQDVMQLNIGLNAKLKRYEQSKIIIPKNINVTNRGPR